MSVTTSTSSLPQLTTPAFGPSQSRALLMNTAIPFGIGYAMSSLFGSKLPAEQGLNMVLTNQVMKVTKLAFDKAFMVTPETPNRQKASQLCAGFTAVVASAAIGNFLGSDNDLYTKAMQNLTVTFYTTVLPLAAIYGVQKLTAYIEKGEKQEEAQEAENAPAEPEAVPAEIQEEEESLIETPVNTPVPVEEELVVETIPVIETTIVEETLPPVVAEPSPSVIDHPLVMAENPSIHEEALPLPPPYEEEQPPRYEDIPPPAYQSRETVELLAMEKYIAPSLFAETKELTKISDVAFKVFNNLGTLLKTRFHQFVTFAKTGQWKNSYTIVKKLDEQVMRLQTYPNIHEFQERIIAMQQMCKALTKANTSFQRQIDRIALTLQDLVATG